GDPHHRGAARARTVIVEEAARADHDALDDVAARAGEERREPAAAAPAAHEDLAVVDAVLRFYLGERLIEVRAVGRVGEPLLAGLEAPGRGGRRDDRLRRHR